MKYHVYAALIAASTQAGPIADAFEKNMPTKAETEAAEAKLDSWAKQAENITNTARPIVKTKMTKTKDAWNYASQQAEREINDFGEELEGNLQDLDEKLLEIDQYAMEDFKAAGVLEDEMKLKAKIEKDLQSCQKAMFEVRQSTMSLKAIRFSDDFHKNMPTKEEVAKVEATVDGWIIRGEDIVDKATPSVKTRNERIKAAWQSMEQADEKVAMELIDDLEKAQMDFQNDLTRAEEKLERTLKSNGTVADFEKLEAQIEADLQQMEQMHSIVMKMHPVVADKVVKNEVKKNVVKNEVRKANRAANRLSNNLAEKRLCNHPSVHGGDCSVFYETDSQGNTYLCANDLNSALQKDPSTRINGQFRCKRGAGIVGLLDTSEVAREMQSDALTAEEWETKKSMVISWVSDFEDIVAKAEPIAQQREQEVEYELEEFGEEFEELFEETLEDMEKIDKDFTVAHDQAHKDMKNQLQTKGGAVDQFEDLIVDIDATLSKMEWCMSKVKRSTSLLKIQNRRGNTLSLGQVADAMKQEIPSGKDVVKIEGMVTGWVKQAEAIEAKAKPAVETRNQQWQSAFESGLNTVEEEATRAIDEFERNDMEFIHKVETAQDDMINSWQNTGIIADGQKLGQDIETQFNTWEKNMARRAPVQSLTAQQSKAVSQNLRSLEADLDMVLKSM